MYLLSGLKRGARPSVVSSRVSNSSPVVSATGSRNFSPPGAPITWMNPTSAALYSPRSHASVAASNDRFSGGVAAPTAAANSTTIANAPRLGPVRPRVTQRRIFMPGHDTEGPVRRADWIARPGSNSPGPLSSLVSASAGPDQRHGVRNHLLRRPAPRPQLADAAVAVRLAQLLRRRLHDQRMVEEDRRLRPAQQTRQLNLASGRGEEID